MGGPFTLARGRILYYNTASAICQAKNRKKIFFYFFPKGVDFGARVWYIIITEREVIKMKMRLFRIHWDGGDRISSFFLKTRLQAESIAKQYKNVVKVEEVYY
jgi:prolipoprotein diacylglyceryltransferase